MNLRSSLRALALAGVCALPLPAGVLTFTFTESTPSTVSVTAQLTGALNSTNWSSVGFTNTTYTPKLNPLGAEIYLTTNPAPSPALKGYGATNFTTSGWGSLPVGDYGTGSSVITSVNTQLSGTAIAMEIASNYVDIYFPQSFVLGATSSLTSTVVFNTSFSALGVTAGQTMSYIIGTGGTQDTVSIIISGGGGGGGGGSSVPDAGPGPALALLLGGLGLRQWRSSRRAPAAS